MSRLTRAVLINSQRHYLFILRGLSEKQLDTYKLVIWNAVEALGGTPETVGVAGIWSNKAGEDYAETEYPLDGVYLVFVHSSRNKDDSGRPQPVDEDRLDADMADVRQAYAIYLDVAEENVIALPVFGELPEITVRVYA